MNRRSALFWMAAFFGLVVGLATHHAICGTLTIPNVFSSGSTISSSEMNANFTAVANLINGNVDTTNIATDGVGAAEIALGAVGTEEIADGTVAADDLATDCVTTTNVQDGAITEALLASACVTTTKIQDDTITWPKMDDAATAVPGSYNNLKVVGTATAWTITASDLAIEDPSAGEWIMLRDITVSVTPTSGSAAIGGQSTNFTAALSTHYYLWVVATQQGQARGVISRYYTPATVEAEVAAINSSYKYVRLVSSAYNTAATYYAAYPYLQLGSKVRLHVRRSLAAPTTDATDQHVSVTTCVPTAIASMWDMEVNLDVVCGTGYSQRTGTLTIYYDDAETYTICQVIGYCSYDANGAGSDADNPSRQIVDFRGENGYLNYDWVATSQTETASIYVTGFSIDELRR